MAETSATQPASLKIDTDAIPVSRSVNPAVEDLEKNAPSPCSQLPSDSSKTVPSPLPSLLQRTKTFLSAEISTVHADLLLLICCFISGLVDSTIYDAFGTFVSMQTGNTVFLGLGGSTSHSTSKPYGWAKSFVSLACFALGCAFFSHATHRLGIMKRRSLVFSFGLQSVMILVAAAVVQGGVVNGSLKIMTDDVDWWTVLPIALLSFQASGQIVGSRSLKLSEIPTVVLTSMIHDITTDRGLLKAAKNNVKRNRRIVGFFSLLSGAIVGGFITERTERMQVPLWIAGGIKLGITVAWLLWPEEPAHN